MPIIDTLHYLFAGTLTLGALLLAGLPVLMGIFLLDRFFTASCLRQAPWMALLRIISVGSVALLLIGLYGWGWWVEHHQNRATPRTTVVDVQIQNHVWKVRSLEGIEETNTIHVPVDMPVLLKIRADKNKYAFSIPAFRVGQSLAPKAAATLRFQADQPGRYAVRTSTVVTVVVLPVSTYAAWADASAAALRPQDPAKVIARMISDGAQLYQKWNCASCHRADGAAVAPTLENLYRSAVTLEDGSTVTADDAYLRESILNSRARVVKGFAPIMPSFEGQISDADADALVAYVKSLRSGQGGSHAAR